MHCHSTQMLSFRAKRGIWVFPGASQKPRSLALLGMTVHFFDTVRASLAAPTAPKNIQYSEVRNRARVTRGINRTHIPINPNPFAEENVSP